jgi:hypothetical protein
MRRQPLSRQDLERLSGHDLANLKFLPEERLLLRRILADRESERVARVASVEEESRPIVADLRGVGVSVPSIGMLDRQAPSHQLAIPVLLHHLTRTHSDMLRAVIAQKLTVRDPQIIAAWPMLVQQYLNAPTGSGIIAPNDKRSLPFMAKDALADLLASVVAPETLFLLQAIRRSRSTSAKNAILELHKDPELREEIESWSKRKRT